MIDKILSNMKELTLEDTLKIKAAYEFAKLKHEGKKRLSGDDFIAHPTSVALILTELNVDVVTIQAALLHEVINHSMTTKDELVEKFGFEIANIVDSISKINKLELSDNSESSAIYLRKVLVGIAEDRIIQIETGSIRNRIESCILSVFLRFLLWATIFELQQIHPQVYQACSRLLFEFSFF